MVESLVSLIPEVGQLIDILLIIFWPDVTKKQPDIWTLIRDRIGKLIDSKLLAKELEQREAELLGLKDTMEQYVDAKIHEKGSFMSAMLTQANTIYEELTTTSNALHVAPLLVAHSHLHLSLLRERLEHGKKMYEEDNTPLWRKELQGYYDKYKKYFDDFLVKWKTWRFGTIQAKWWRTTAPQLLPPFFYYIVHGRAIDTFSGEKIEYSQERNPHSDHFKDVMQSAQKRMQNQQYAGVAGALASTSLLHIYLQGKEKDPPKINPALVEFDMGPYCPANLGLSKVDQSYTNISDTPGRIKKINIREWNSIDGIQFIYTDHDGHFIGDPKGGTPHSIGVDVTKAHFTGLWMQFANGIMIALDIHKSDGSHSGKLGNRSGWSGPSRSAVVDSFYELVQGKFAKGYGPSSTEGTAVITLHFKARCLVK